MIELIKGHHMRHTKRIVELTRQINEARSKLPWVYPDSGYFLFSNNSELKTTYSFQSDNWRLETTLNFRLLFVMWLFMGGKISRIN